MTSMKFFAYRPYALSLLVAGLVLGWAGSAAADITLSVDKPTIREEDGRTEITVTAESNTKVTANTVVSLKLGARTFDLFPGNILPNGVGNVSPGHTVDEHGRWTGYGQPWWAFGGADRRRGARLTPQTKPGGDWKDWFNSRAHVNDRFAITLPTLVIPKDQKKATGTIILTPVDNDERGFYNTYDDFTQPFGLDQREDIDFVFEGGQVYFRVDGVLYPDDGVGTEQAYRIRRQRGTLLGRRYPDLIIKIDGLAGSDPVNTVNRTEIRVTDDEKLTNQVNLSFSPASLSKDAGPTEVTVTATLNGGTLRSDQTFTLIHKTQFPGAHYENFPPGVRASDVLTRDTDYSATSASLTIRRNKPSGKATITIDPKGKVGYIALAAGTERLVLTGIDLNLDGDMSDSLALSKVSRFVDSNTKRPDRAVFFNEEGLGCTPTTSGEPLSQHDLNFDGRCDGIIREGRIGIDLNGDGRIEYANINQVINFGTGQAIRQNLGIGAQMVLFGQLGNADNRDPNRDGGALLLAAIAAKRVPWIADRGAQFSTEYNPNTGVPWELPVVPGGTRPDEWPTSNPRFVLVESKLPQYIEFPHHLFEITDTPVVTLKSATDGLTATPATIREGAGRQEIALKVTLKDAVASDTRVTFTINPQEGRRDIDYTVVLSDLVVPKGQTSASTTLVLTPVDNEVVNDARTFDVVASVGESATDATATITIVDDETQSTQIMLTASPAELKAGTGANNVTITGTLDGQSFDEDVDIVLVVTTDTDADGDVDDADKAATRDTEYTAILRGLTIEAGEVSGTTTVSVTPLAGGDKKIGLTALKSPVKNDDDEDVTVTTTVITLKDGDPETGPGILAFDEDVDVVSTVFEYVVGTAIEPYVLPAATGGIGDKTYSVSATLPAGLVFDAETRTLSGTPLTAGDATVVYTVIDSAPDPVNTAVLSLTFEIGTAPPATVRVASITSTHSSIRENGETTAILLTATLAAPAPRAETILFTIAAPSSGTPAVRDADYTAVIGGSVVIAAGETQGRTLLTLTPLDNEEVDGNKYLGAQASASGGSAQTDIKIADDETPSTSLSLEVTPHTLSEDAGVTQLTVTAMLDGKALDAAATVTLSIDPESAATRDLDYSALYNPSLSIPAGSTSGSITLLIDPTADNEDEGNETITLTASAEGLTSASAHITLADAGTEATLPPEATPLSFADGTSIADQKYTAGTEISAMELPAAVGGVGDIAYSVSDLPSGLSFDAATRTISGTPDAATDEPVEITYTAADGTGASATLTFSITVNAEITFDLVFFGAGKLVPTASDDGASIPEFISGQPVNAFTLPSATGGTEPLTYTLSPDLPAGLSFDAATRTISGTPQSEGSPVYIYTVTDALGASVTMQLQTRPAAFALATNYPNPFNPATTIQYALPQPADVQLTVYNVVGQVVRTLVAEHQAAGRYLVAWDATNDNGQSLSAGVYFYRLQAGGEFHAVRKMLLLK